MDMLLHLLEPMKVVEVGQELEVFAVASYMDHLNRAFSAAHNLLAFHHAMDIEVVAIVVVMEPMTEVFVVDVSSSWDIHPYHHLLDYLCHHYNKMDVVVEKMLTEISCYEVIR